jgi:rhamnosyltransferase
MVPNPSDTSVPASPLRAELQKVKICAVMVTYNPDSPLEQSVRALLTEVDRLIIIDNGSEPPIRAQIEAIASACQVEVIWNRENLGLATALNMGIRSALGSDDYAWIATFDQDSQVSPGYRDAMLNAYVSCPYRDRIGIVGPHHVMFPDELTDRHAQEQFTPLFREITVIMQSGIFVSTKVLREAGLFDDSFFIDYVDIEFCLRLRKSGYKVMEACNAALAHRLGDPSRHTIFGKTTTVYSHSPLRRYYASRNRLRMYPRYLLSDFSWICHDAWSWFKEVVKLVLFEQDRRRKLLFIAKGAWDAVRGRSGMYAQ